MKITRGVASAALAAFVLVGCTGGTPATTAAGEDRSSPLGDGRYQFRPVSAPAVPDRQYAFDLYTHCGIDFLVDFDRAFWDLQAELGQETSPVGRPADHGTMTLRSHRVAVYESEGGARLLFVRAGAIRDIPLCS